MYEGWGYEQVGEKLPFPDSPLYDVMVLALKNVCRERPRPGR